MYSRGCQVQPDAGLVSAGLVDCSPGTQGVVYHPFVGGRKEFLITPLNSASQPYRFSFGK